MPDTLLIAPESVTPKELPSGKTVWNIAVADREERTGWNCWEKSYADALLAKVGQVVKVEYTEKAGSGGWLNRTIVGVDGVEKVKRSGGMNLAPLLELGAKQSKQLDEIKQLLERIANAVDPQPIPAGTPKARTEIRPGDTEAAPKVGAVSPPAQASAPSSPPSNARVSAGTNRAAGAPGVATGGLGPTGSGEHGNVSVSPPESGDRSVAEHEGGGRDSTPATSASTPPAWIPDDLWTLLLATGKRPQILPAFLRGMLSGDGTIPVPGSAERVALEAKIQEAAK